MKKNFYISAIYISPPYTMGGNTKILLELINNLHTDYNFIIFTTEPETFIKNINCLSEITLIDVSSPYRKMNYADHFKEIMHIYNFYKNYFLKQALNPDDYFYSASDFAPDILPILWLKRKYKFKWIATFYLFIVSPVENLIRQLRFPPLKYSIYYIYQKILFYISLNKFDLCLITNDIDKKQFPRSRWKNILAIYGGVNSEQICEARQNRNNESCKYDAVFCSRLHPQKGIYQLLDVWAKVVNIIPLTKLAIIGNGDASYEERLRKKSKKLNLESNLIWLGYVNNAKKYEIYLDSKMLLHATIYDNNGMVAAEALCSGLPVVMYDLKAFKNLYNCGCVKVKEKNIDLFSREIIKLLSDNEYREQIKPKEADIKKLLDFWQWKNRALIFNNFLKNNEKNNN